MSTQSFFKSLISTSTRRRPSRRCLPVWRLCLEALEDRRLLTFNLAVNYAADLAPQAVVVGDFNGDTRLDLAVVNYSSNNVSILLGNAGGTFQPAQNSATGTGPLSVAVGDFNADGKLDLATASAGDVSVLLGNGNGTFGAPTNIAIGSDTRSVAVGDFNGDGKLDLGVTLNVDVFDGCGYYGCYSHFEGRANVLLGTGTGSFSAPIAYSLGNGNHTSAAVADFNGDGKQDFASANSDYGTVDVLLGTGTGTFGAPTGFGAGPYPVSVAARDVNADGKLDLVTANFNGANLSVLLGNGLGSFGAAQNYIAGSQPRSVAMADFNGDGKIDLATANGDTGTVSVLLGTGTGAFKPPVNVATSAGPIGVAVGDFNGDGRPDAASANSNSNNVSVLLNNGIWPALDAPSITINDVTVTEGNIGTVNATFTVSLSAAYGQTVSIRYATADSSATASSDYQATSGTLTFNPGGPLTQTITVLVNGDRLPEYTESFLLLLTNSTNAFVADATGVGTILDDEPTISIVDYVSGVEGNTGTTAFTFTVTLSAVYDAPVTVAYATADLTPDEQGWYGPGATAGVDYTAKSGTVTFNPGQPLTQTITVLVTGDRLAEWDESFFVNLSNPTSAHLGSSLAVATIVDDEPYVSIGNATAVLEGHSGTKSMTFTVTLSAASNAPVTVTYATGDGSATAGGDYQAKTGTLTFAAGETSQTITVLVNGDRLGEYDESFYVNLTGTTTNAHIGNSLGSGTIQDDEPRISISDVSKAEGKRGQTTLFTFTVTLSTAYDQAVTMSFRTVNGTATSGSGDYVAKTGTLTFTPGVTSMTITIEVKGDSKREANEYFYLDLYGLSINGLFTKNRGIGTILNDD